MTEGWASFAVASPVPIEVISERRALRELTDLERSLVEARLMGVSGTAAANAFGLQSADEKAIRRGAFSKLVRSRNVDHERKPVARSNDSRNETSKEARRVLSSLLSLSEGDTKVVEISPDIARALLARNPTNRSITAARVQRFAADIASGAWELNNSGIGIGADGELYDGQHRLHAIVRANKPVRMLVVCGLKRESRATIDQGRPRSVGDNLRILDGEVDGVRIVGWLNAIVAIETNKPMSLSHAMVRERKAVYEEGIRWLLEHGPRGRPYYRAAVVGAFAFAFKAFADETKTFVGGYTSGAGLSPGSPVLSLRDHIADPVNVRVDSPRVISLKTLRALMAHVQDEPMARLHSSEEAVEFFRRKG